MVAGRSRCTVLRVRRPAWKPFQPLTASGKTPGRFPMLRLIAGFLAGRSISLCFAQDDAVVITAARFLQPRSQTFLPVNVITAENIAQSRQQTLVEVLQALGGADITNAAQAALPPQGIYS